MSALGIAIQTLTGEPEFLARTGYISTQNYIELLKQFASEMKKRRAVAGTFSVYNTMMMRPEDSFSAGTYNSIILNNSVRLTYTVPGDFYVVIFDTPGSNPFHSINLAEDVKSLLAAASKDSFKIADLKQRYSRVFLGLTRILYGLTGNDILEGDIMDVSITKKSMKDVIEEGLFKNNRLLHETKQNRDDFADLELLFQMSISFPNDDHKAIDALPYISPPTLSSLYDFDAPPKPAKKIVEKVKPKIKEAPKLKKVEQDEEEPDEEDEDAGIDGFAMDAGDDDDGFGAEGGDDDDGFAADRGGGVDAFDVGDLGLDLGTGGDDGFGGAGGDDGFGDTGDDGFGDVGGDDGFGDTGDDGFGDTGDDGFGDTGDDGFAAGGDDGFGGAGEDDGFGGGASGGLDDFGMPMTSAPAASSSIGLDDFDFNEKATAASAYVPDDFGMSGGGSSSNIDFKTTNGFGDATDDLFAGAGLNESVGSGMGLGASMSGGGDIFSSPDIGGGDPFLSMTKPSFNLGAKIVEDMKVNFVQNKFTQLLLDGEITLLKQVIEPPSLPVKLDVKISKASLIDTIQPANGNVQQHPQLKPQSPDQHIFQYTMLPNTGTELKILKYRVKESFKAIPTLIQCLWRKTGNLVELTLQIKIHPQLPSTIDAMEVSILVPPFGTDQFSTRFTPVNANLDRSTRSVVWLITEQSFKGQEKTFYAGFQLVYPPPSFVDRPWEPCPAIVKLMCNTKSFIPYDISISGDPNAVDIKEKPKMCSWLTTNFINQP